MGDLEQKLKTCSSSRRIRVARELARTGVPGAVPPLVRMLEGGRYWGGTRPRYYDFKARLVAVRALSAFEGGGRERAHRHLDAAVDWLIEVVETGNYKRQLAAIKTLGYIQGDAREKSLRYLNSLIAGYVVGEPVADGPALGCSGKRNTELLMQYSCKVTFPRAKRRLGKELYLSYKKRVFVRRGETPERELAELVRETKKLVKTEESRLGIRPELYLTISKPYKMIQAAVKRLRAA